MRRLMSLTLLAACTTEIALDKDDTVAGYDTATQSDTDTQSDTSTGQDDTNAPDADGCAQAATLLDLSTAPGAGGDYAKPQLSGRCTADRFTVTSNGMIPYTFVATTPNALTEQDFTWTITRTPEVAEETTDIPLLGLVGFAVNGQPFFGPNEGAFPDPYGDPVYNAIMDPCLGHTASSYHYHALLQQCLTPAAVTTATPWTLPEVDTAVESPILGWALDGFPVYGPQGCVDAACDEVVTFQSGWERTGDPTTYAWDAHEYRASDDPTVLDACNGRVGPDGTYRYHATATFPYILGCYAGTPEGAGAEGGPPGGGPPGGGPPGGGPPP